MSLTSDLPALPNPARAPLWRRLGIMLAAVAIIALAMGLIGLWLGPVSKPPPRNPFGMGLREATPSGSLGAWILSVQSGFYGSLQAGVAGDEAERLGAVLPPSRRLRLWDLPCRRPRARQGRDLGLSRGRREGPAQRLRLEPRGRPRAGPGRHRHRVRREHPAARHRRHHEQARDERGAGELRRRRPARRRHRLAQGRQVSGRHGPGPQSLLAAGSGRLRPRPHAAARGTRPPDALSRHGGRGARRRASAPARGPSSSWSSPCRRASSRRASPPPSPWRSARRSPPAPSPRLRSSSRQRL